MRKSLPLILIIQLLFCFSLLSQKIDNDSLDNFLSQVIKDFQIPGMAVGVVQGDSIAFLKAYGLRAKGKEDKVNVETTFGIGSISKSFTALTIGILVDEGLVEWDDPVRKHLPYFELYHPYVSENFTVRDLFIHKSGLKSVSGGTLWYHSKLSREEVIKGMKYLEPVSGFREKSAYQNVMFVVAAEIVEKVTGQTWDDFVKERILDPLQMRSTTSLSADREANINIARPHIWDENFVDKIEVVQESGDNLAPAGFIYSSANDMLKYIRLMLDDGNFEGRQILSKEVMAEVFSPQSLFQISSPPFGNEFSSYGFGWWLTPYMGHKIIEHSGGIDGMSAQLVMVKDLNIGIIILTNASKEPAAFAVKSKFLEMALEDRKFDIYDRLLARRKTRIQQMKDRQNAIAKVENTEPSLALESYSGDYKDRMYGEILIGLNSKQELELNFTNTPLFSGQLIHWHYDTFKIDWQDPRVPDGFITFEFSAEHKITGFNITQENLLDVDFEELKILRID